MTAERGRQSEALLMRLIILALAVTVELASLAVADEEPVRIPLKEIWAYEMPGTLDINQLDQGRAQKELVEPLLANIEENWANDRGSAVPGEGLEALRAFYKIKLKEREPALLSKKLPISIVFYTRLLYPYVHLHSIAKERNVVTIRYHLIPHRTADSTQHIALIPLGKLCPGKYVVKLERLPMDGSKEFGLPEPSQEQERKICKPFSFTVTQ
jgi:hypothetical protein